MKSLALICALSYQIFGGSRALAEAAPRYYYPINFKFETRSRCEEFLATATANFELMTLVPVDDSFCSDFHSKYAVVLSTRAPVSAAFDTESKVVQPISIIPTNKTGVKEVLDYDVATDVVSSKLIPYSYTVDEFLTERVDDEATCLSKLGAYLTTPFGQHVVFSFCELDKAQPGQGWRYVLTKRI